MPRLQALRGEGRQRTGRRVVECSGRRDGQRQLGQQVEEDRAVAGALGIGPARQVGRGRQRQRRFADRRQRGIHLALQAAAQHVDVARAAELAEQRCSRIGPDRRRRHARPALEVALRGAQPTQRHAQLVHRFGRAAAGGDFAPVRRGLREHVAQHGGPGVASRCVLAKAQRRGLDGGHRLARRQPARQAIAAFGLGPHVQPQAMAQRQAARHLDHSLRRSAQQLHLQLAHRPAALDAVGTAGHDLAAIERQFHRAVAAAQRPVQAPDVGAVLRAKCRGVRLAVARCERGAQRRMRRRAGMARRIGLLRHLAGGHEQRHVVLAARHAMRRPGLQRLHPAPPFLAQSQRDAGRRQAAVRGVEIDRLQPGALRGRRRHRALDGGQRRGRHLQLEFDLGHRANMARPYDSDRTVTAHRWGSSGAPGKMVVEL